VIAFWLIVAAVAATSAPDAGDLDTIGGFDIRSSSIDYNYATGDYTIPSRFTATNGGTDITAERAKGNSKKKLIVADGSVVIHQTHTPLKSAAAQSHFTEGPSTLTCDHINANGNTKIYVVTGHVHFMQGDRDMVADHGTFNDATNQVHMEGLVVIKDQGQTLNADAVDYDTQTGDGKASGNVTVVSPVATPQAGVAGEAPHKKKGRK
jgi:lipopolysaccharide assembly outer membrane protein LptD (OstA)